MNRRVFVLRAETYKQFRDWGGIYSLWGAKWGWKNPVEHRATLITEKDSFVLRYDPRRKKQLSIESREWSIVNLRYRCLFYTDYNFPLTMSWWYSITNVFTETRKSLIICVQIAFLWKVFMNLSSMERNICNVRQVIRFANISYFF
jgi:hypothetical protein